MTQIYLSVLLRYQRPCEMQQLDEIKMHKQRRESDRNRIMQMKVSRPEIEDWPTCVLNLQNVGQSLQKNWAVIKVVHAWLWRQK